ncbi:helix-turn-helix domain-containing protein [Lacticaseibacillus yichunensis]|uniref:Helix-turn-helix domain-containing protein n=1 Tax=Lacticaseibacillus yichunensis TaxID=2486015 RepID=A0ABW4CNM5_9LACO|nr:helix-turn-helix transcriptional regulator [Lacticaseibacillus yichunensis]
MKEQSSGALFRAIRLSRGWTIDQVRGDISRSTVSRFENDQVALLIERFNMLLQQSGISFSEVMSNREQENYTENFTSFDAPFLWQQLQLAMRSESVGPLKPVLAQLERLNGPMAVIMLSAVKMVRDSFDPANATSSEKDGQPVQTFLTHPGTWYDLEYRLFALLIYIYPRNAAGPLLKRALSEYAKYSNSQYAGSFMLGLHNATLKAIVDHDETTSQMLLAGLRGFDSDWNGFFLRYRITVLEFVLDYSLTKEMKNVVALDQILATLKLLKADAILAGEVQWIKELDIPIHDPA